MSGAGRRPCWSGRSKTTGNLEHRVWEEHTDIAERTRDELSEAGLSTEGAVRTTVPHTAILRYATEQGIDLVVMGSPGRSNLKRQLLGSVAATVLRTVDVPVLVVTRSG